MTEAIKAGNRPRKSCATTDRRRLLKASLWTIFGVLAVINILLGIKLSKLKWQFKTQPQRRPTAPPKQVHQRPKSFYDTDGVTGYSYDVVPDILHLVRYNQAELSFPDAVFYRAMYLNHRPQKIMVHCSPCGFTGPYARLVEGIPFSYVPTVFPKDIFGTPINPEWGHHSTDIVRMRVLMRYGGIYLDADVFVVQSLRRFLRYEATVGCVEDGTFGNMIMIAHNNSRVMRLFMDTYREFNASLWDYNSADVPTTELVYKRPHLFHRMYHGLETYMLPDIYLPHFIPYWRNAYAMHTLINHRHHVKEDPLYGQELNETTIRDYDTALGQMVRSVLFGTSDFVAPDARVLNVTELAAMKDRGDDLTRMDTGSSRPFYYPN
ncbi:uncharacterized protein [Dermacentor albipictus]|uniref:uncharacterized protein isoform X1 n=1 Tax=Dermacentor albipictus TaxID=60249 RepID=UPI0031FBA739